MKILKTTNHEEGCPLPRSDDLPHHGGIYGLFGPGREKLRQDVKKTISRLKLFKLIVDSNFINHNRKPIKTKTIKKY